RLAECHILIDRRPKPGPLRDTSQHSRPDFFAVVDAQTKSEKPLRGPEVRGPGAWARAASALSVRHHPGEVDDFGDERTELCEWLGRITGHSPPDKAQSVNSLRADRQRNLSLRRQIG